MAADANGRDAVVLGGELQTDRRDFMKSAAAVGLLGAAGVVPALGHPVQAAQKPETAEPNLKPPFGISPRDIPDLRFPICYKESVPAAVGVMTQYFAALGQRDLKGMAEMLHFPFGTFERTEAVVVHSPDELMAHAPASMNITDVANVLHQRKLSGNAT